MSYYNKEDYQKDKKDTFKLLEGSNIKGKDLNSIKNFDFYNNKKQFLKKILEDAKLLNKENDNEIFNKYIIETESSISKLEEEKKDFQNRKGKYNFKDNDSFWSIVQGYKQEGKDEINERFFSYTKEFEKYQKLLGDEQKDINSCIETIEAFELIIHEHNSMEEYKDDDVLSEYKKKIKKLNDKYLLEDNFKINKALLEFFLNTIKSRKEYLMERIQHFKK